MPFVLLLFFYSCNVKKQNRLAKATSPYLQEHADNPVDWYEWGEEALAAAKKENKPLLISIGYAACHWCHQMEAESFMDTAVARVMNDNFICIKVDREERPDIDKVYMNACELISGNAGWPLNAFALPDGKPFYAGTYYSKQSWINLLTRISETYKTKNNKVVYQAQSLSKGIAQLEFSVLADSAVNVVDKISYQQLFSKVYEKTDLLSGGFKGSPKFPSPSAIEFLLQYYFLTKDKSALDAATTTLTNMALGGIYDQLGGGFARYATDSLWRIPHFEKMLYDNAQLISAYAHAYQVTGNKFFIQIAMEIIAFVQHNLSNGEGAYFSSVNADTDEGEGQFYTWSVGELKENLPDAYKEVQAYYNVSEKGNWKSGRNVLYSSSTPLQYAHRFHTDSVGFLNKLSTARASLLKARDKRTKPTIDDKVLTSWNALLIKGFIDTYAAVGNNTYLQYALSGARFMEKMMLEDGKLFRNYKNGVRSVNAFLEDYGLLAKTYIRLYQVTFDKHWLILSKKLIDYSIKNFYDPASGMFYYTGLHSDSNLIRKIEIADNAIPASNSVIAESLYGLGIYFADTSYTDKASQMLSRLTKQLATGEINYYTSWCMLAGLFSYGTNEVAIVGQQALTKNLALQKEYLPASLFMGSPGVEDIPFLEGKRKDGHTLIYVCTNGACKKPEEDVYSALKQLKN
ncbi:MAG: thioredoxin domain-containing protein [Chitinophagaceae bacterium]